MLVGRQCQAKEGGTDRDFQEFITRTVPTTQTSKCLHACVLESFSVVSVTYRMLLDGILINYLL